MCSIENTGIRVHSLNPRENSFGVWHVLLLNGSTCMGVFYNMTCILVIQYLQLVCFFLGSKIHPDTGLRLNF